MQFLKTLLGPTARLASRLNVAKPICQILLGHHGKTWHRMLTGLIIMVVGVVVVHYADSFNDTLFGAITFFLESVGYGLHGIGLTPYVDLLAESLTK